MKNEDAVPFLVGKIGREGRKMVVLEETAPAPIPGPWELRGIFTSARRPPRGPRPA